MCVYKKTQMTKMLQYNMIMMIIDSFDNSDNYCIYKYHIYIHVCVCVCVSVCVLYINGYVDKNKIINSLGYKSIVYTIFIDVLS